MRLRLKISAIYKTFDNIIPKEPLIAMPYVQFGLSVRCEYLHDVCLFYFWCVLRAVREIFPLLDMSHDEKLIRY